MSARRMQGLRSVASDLDLLIGRDHERLEACPVDADPPFALEGRRVRAGIKRQAEPVVIDERPELIARTFMVIDLPGRSSA